MNHALSLKNYIIKDYAPWFNAKMCRENGKYCTDRAQMQQKDHWNARNNENTLVQYVKQSDKKKTIFQKGFID